MEGQRQGKPPLAVEAFVLEPDDGSLGALMGSSDARQW
jgi:hypothetical protein